MTYKEAVTYLESLIDYERTPAGAAAARVWNLDRMRQMLHPFGDPHLALPCVHIAGTKGKGSTAAMTASILSASGRRTGLYEKLLGVARKKTAEADVKFDDRGRKVSAEERELAENVLIVPQGDAATET